VREREVISKFDGIATDIHRAKLPDGLFQVDQNGDRHDRGTWKVRKGYKHSDLPKASSAVLTLQGVELPGGDFGLVAVEQSAGPAGSGKAVAYLNPGVQGAANPAYATLDSGLDGNHRYTSAEYKRKVYLSNGWGKLRRWDGTSLTLDDAGIPGPDQDLDSWTPAPAESAGNCEVGTHLVPPRRSVGLRQRPRPHPREVSRRVGCRYAT